MSKKENLKRILLCVFMIMGTFGFVSWINAPHQLNADIQEDTSTIAYSNTYTVINDDAVKTPEEHSADSVKNSVKEKLISEVHKYIRKQAPDASHTLAKTLVDNGLKHNIDICFMMCQGQVETNFGTTGTGRSCRTRSMFGVMGRTYSSYTNAIIDYINVLKQFYLVHGRTEQHLLNNYVTYNGQRYAGNTNYENELKSTYRTIRYTTKIYKLQQQYKQLT